MLSSSFSYVLPSIFLSHSFSIVLVINSSTTKKKREIKLLHHPVVHCFTNMYNQIRSIYGSNGIYQEWMKAIRLYYGGMVMFVSAKYSLVSYYESFEFFLSQTSLSLIKSVENYNNIFNTKQAYYQNIFNAKFN